MADTTTLVDGIQTRLVHDVRMRRMLVQILQLLQAINNSETTTGTEWDRSQRAGLEVR